MPELPEVETVVRSLAPHLTGRRILSARFTSRLVTRDPGKLAARLAGRTIQKIERRGKFILVSLDEGLLVVHLGMTGSLRLDGIPGAHTYGVFRLDRGELRYEDPRQFGRIEWNPRRIARLGPEPLEIGAADFIQRLRARHARIKPLLLNQQFLAGVGNIYADEALFAAGVHPLAVASRLGRRRAERLHQSLREVLTLAIEHRGSSISDYVDASGRRGEFQSLHCVYGREGEPCLKCGSPIRKIVAGGRGTHFCPRCQRP